MTAAALLKHRKKLWFRDLKKTLACARCPESHWMCLDFHHMDGASKDGSVSRMVGDNRPLADIMAEIGKCEVLCANCHRKAHAAEQEMAHYRREQLLEGHNGPLEESREARRTRASEHMKALWQNPEWRAKKLATDNSPTKLAKMTALRSKKR